MSKIIFSPYRSNFCVGFSVPCFYKNSAKQIVLIEDEMSEIFIIDDHTLKSLGFEWEEQFKNETYTVATRKEIKAAGLWDYVTNKDDYSSEEDKIETELDEYLRIGEEMEKERQRK